MATPKANWTEGEYFTPAAANTVGQAILDLQGQVTALDSRNSLTELESMPTSGGITTMTVASKEIIEFTGTLTQTVKLPSTSIIAGAHYVLVNNSTGLLTVQTSTAAVVMTLASGSESTFIALVATPTTAANWQFINPVDTSLAQTLTSKTLTTPTLTTPVINGVSTGTGVATAGTASTLAMRDASGNVTGNALVSTVATGTAPLTVASATVVANLNAATTAGYGPAQSAAANTLAARDGNTNLQARGFISGLTSTVTSATTVTLIASSSQVQEFTGTLAQTVVLPTAGVIAGQQFAILNSSTGLVTVQSSALATIHVLAPGAESIFTALVATPTTAAGWEDSMFATSYAAGKSLTVNNSLTLAGTDATVMTFPTTSATLARTDAANTFTGVQTMTSPALTTPVINGTPTGTGLGSASAASTLALRDGFGRLIAHSFAPLFTTQATATATTTLTAGAAQIQEFTGTLTQTCVLPTTGLSAGSTYTIINNSTGAVTVQSSALAAIGAALTTGQSAEFIALIATPTTAANWHRR